MGFWVPRITGCEPLLRSPKKRVRFPVLVPPFRTIVPCTTLIVEAAVYDMGLQPWAAATFVNYLKVKQSLYRPITGCEGSRRLKLPAFQVVDI